MKKIGFINTTVSKKSYKMLKQKLEGICDDVIDFNRPELDFFEQLKLNKGDSVVFYDLVSISSNLPNMIELLEHFSACGIEVEFISHQESSEIMSARLLAETLKSADKYKEQIISVFTKH